MRTETFQPPERVKLKQLVNLAMGMAQMRISADDFMHRIALRDIFYTQDSIKRFFQDGRPLEKMEAELRYGVKDVTDIPCITVVPTSGANVFRQSAIVGVQEGVSDRISEGIDRRSRHSVFGAS